MEQVTSKKAVVRLGELEVLASGSLGVPNNQPLKVLYDGIEIAFSFIDEGKDEFRIQKEAKDNRLTLLLYNFNNPLGQGVIEPELFGYSDNHELYISFWIWTPIDNVRWVNYTIFKGPKRNIS